MAPRILYYLMRGSFSLFYSMWLTVTLLYHAEMVTDDPLKLVLLSVVLEGTIFLLEIPTGLVADSYSRKWSTIIGAFLIGGAYCLEGSAPIYGRVLVAHFIYGVGFTFYSGASDAWLADEIGAENASPVFMRGAQISLLFAQVGIVGAMLIGQAGLYIPIRVAGAAIILIGVFLIVTMTENGFSPEQTEGNIPARLAQTLRKNIDLIRVRPSLVNVLLVGVIVGASVGGFDRLYTPYFLTYNPPYDSVVWYGMLQAVISLSSTCLLEVIRRRAKHLSPEQVPRTIAVLYGCTILGNVVFVLAGQFGLAVVAFWFSQMFRSTTRPLIIIWINQIVESRVRATAISTYWQFNALGHTIGLPFIGLIGRLFSLRVALMSAVLGLSPTLWLLTRRHAVAQKQDLPPE